MGRVEARKQGDIAREYLVPRKTLCRHVVGEPARLQADDLAHRALGARLVIHRADADLGVELHVHGAQQGKRVERRAPLLRPHEQRVDLSHVHRVQTDAAAHALHGADVARVLPNVRHKLAVAAHHVDGLVQDAHAGQHAQNRVAAGLKVAQQLASLIPSHVAVDFTAPESEPVVRLDDLAQHTQERVALGLAAHVCDAATAAPHEHAGHQKERLGRQRLVVARQQLRHGDNSAPALRTLLPHLEERQVDAVVAAEAALDGLRHAELKGLGHAHTLVELLGQRRRHQERVVKAVGERDDCVVAHHVVHLVDEQKRVLAKLDLGQHGLGALERAEDRHATRALHRRAHLLQVGGAAVVRVHEQHLVARQEGREPRAQLVDGHLERRDAHDQRVVAPTQRVASDERLAAATEELQRLAVSGFAVHVCVCANGVDCFALVRPQLVVDLGGWLCHLNFLTLVRQSAVDEHATRVLDVLAQVDLQWHRRVDVPRLLRASVHHDLKRAQIVRANVPTASKLGLTRVIHAVHVLGQKVHTVVAKSWTIATNGLGSSRETQKAMAVEVVYEAALEQLLLGNHIVVPHGVSECARVMRHDLQLIATANMLCDDCCFLRSLAVGMKQRSKRIFRRKRHQK